MNAWVFGIARRVALGCVFLSGTPDAVLAAEIPACLSFAELARRLDARIAEIQALKPGLSLGEFTGKYAFQGLNFWDDVGTERETVFFVTVTDGNAQVSDELVCRFDRSERLRSCRRECCRHATRTITEAQHNSIAVGESRAEVERRLCAPSGSERNPKNTTRVITYYHVDLPIGHHDEGQTVRLIFQDGQLRSKSISPY